MLLRAIGGCARLKSFSRKSWTPLTNTHSIDRDPSIGVAAFRHPKRVHARFSPASAASTTMTETSVTYLNQKDAISVDEELMGPLGFSVDQLMELAGLSVACSLASEYPQTSHRSVLVIAGPGNNGGDGLVAARHLHHFGYDVKIAYPKPTDKPLYNGLVTQCKALGIDFVLVEDLQGVPLRESFDVIVDSIFGFSFQGDPRPPFDVILEMLKPSARPCPIVSVDIPSGWQVETGDEKGDGLQPEMLVSLTAPKLCAKHFTGPHHYLGGRFVPQAIKTKYNLNLPSYPFSSQCVKIEGDGTPAVSDMRLSYTVGSLDETEVTQDPIHQFKIWFSDATKDPGIKEANAMTLATADPSGKPSARIVLLKGVAERGFVFYTNFNSRKGSELVGNGQAALCFFWEPLQRQVRIEGSVEMLPESESVEYFNSRPRSSRIGAWASEQSSVIKDRSVLEQDAKELSEKFSDESVAVPKPPHWGGFLVRPNSVEFWQGRPSRLHDRLRYRKDGDEGWAIERLSP
ncbi:hypothetical protein BSKO_13019 [Bryopsis sp. KO-2023]|nr:hypothetical protein BSKO_13019 [Bryopsis sp. KO-2023]